MLQCDQFNKILLIFKRKLFIFIGDTLHASINPIFYKA